MTITTEVDAEELLASLLEAAREQAGSAPGHYHIRRPFDCPQPDCLGMHPAVRLARTCRRTEREARRLITHTHRWIPLLDGAICSECGQTSYTTRELR